MRKSAQVMHRTPRNVAQSGNQHKNWQSETDRARSSVSSKIKLHGMAFDKTLAIFERDADGRAARRLAVRPVRIDYAIGVVFVFQNLLVLLG
jgi:hypothetical protein